MTSKAVPIFPIYYFQDTVDDNDTIKDLLVDKIMNDVKELKIPEGWFTNKLMTSFSGETPGKEIFFGEDRTYQSFLEPRYAKCIDSFFNGVPYSLSIDEIWYNCYTDGEYQEAHDHLSRRGSGTMVMGPHFSCVHFLSFDPTRHKSLAFRDPLDQLRTTSIEMYDNNYEEQYYPDVKEGDFLMFPSYLPHSVAPSPKTLDYPRITIAMNITVLNYGHTNEC